MKAEFVEKIKILLSKAELRELLRLELTPGNQVDSLPRRSKYTGSEEQLDLALSSVTCLYDFDLKMYTMKKIFDITRGMKTIFAIQLHRKGLRNDVQKLEELQK